MTLVPHLRADQAVAHIRLLFVLAALVLVPVEIFCVWSSLETQGEVIEGLLRLMLGINLIPLALFWWRPQAALLVAVLLFALIVPYQLVLLNRLTRINNEVVRIVDSRLRFRATGTPLPVTLDNYTFKDPSVRQYIHSYTVSDDLSEFSLYYFVVNPGISHWYRSKDGWATIQTE